MDDIKIWSRRSKENINTVNEVLQILARELLLKCEYKLAVLSSGGKRTAEEQNAIFLQGHSKCDGYNKKSYHQTGLAIDFVPYVDMKLSWASGLAFLTVAKTVFEVWDKMIESGEAQDYYLHWGGFWGAKDLDNDGLLEISDKLGWDGAHYELRKKEQRNTMKISIN